MWLLYTLYNHTRGSCQCVLHYNKYKNDKLIKLKIIINFINIYTHHILIDIVHLKVKRKKKQQQLDPRGLFDLWFELTARVHDQSYSQINLATFIFTIYRYMRFHIWKLYKICACATRLYKSLDRTFLYNFL